MVTRAGTGAGGMAQGLVTLAAPAEDPSADLGTHVVQLTTSCNSTSRGSKASGLRRHLQTHGVRTCTQIQTHKMIFKINGRVHIYVD